MPIGISHEEIEFAKSIELEVIYSRTFERKLKAESDETDKIKPMDQTHLKVSYLKMDEFQPYVKLGMAQLKDKMVNINIQGLGRRNIELEYGTALSYGGGINGLFKFQESFFYGYDLQYLRSQHRLDKVKHNSETASSKKGEALLQEWHSAFFLGKEFNLD